MKCRMRVVLDHMGSELECPVKGDHLVHRYRDARGKLHLVEFFEYPPPEIPVVEPVDTPEG